jgi:hypothetical protein
MALRLSSADLARFEATLPVLLTPLAHPTIRSWGHVIMRSGEALLGADQALFGLRFGDELVAEGSDANAWQHEQPDFSPMQLSEASGAICVATPSDVVSWWLH